MSTHINLWIADRLRKITGCDISDHVLLLYRGKNQRTVSYYDCTNMKYFKATVNFHITGFTICNIREDKDKNTAA